MYHLVRIDIILGMDWLSKNHVIIECKKREIILACVDLLSGNQILFRGDEVVNHPCIISYVKETKYLKPGCQGFLASVVEAQPGSVKTDPSSVRVVSDYLENRVFY